MHHQFVDIETPQNFKSRFVLDNFKIKKCIVCDFILGCNGDKHNFDIFYYNGKEIYEYYIKYENLNNHINFTCNEFIIKYIIE